MKKLNILSIAGILPIPGLISSNDFVFYTYISYHEQFNDDLIHIIRPTQYKTNIRKILRKETEFNKLQHKRSWNFYGFPVEIFPFFSSRKARDLHAILSYTIFILNRRKLDTLIKENNYDIVHAQYIYPDGLLAYIIKKKYHIPFTITTHNELFYFKYPFSRWLGKKILKNAHRILPINFRNVNYFNGLGLKNVEILPLGFNKSFIREQKTASNDKVSIVTVCELIPLKNVDKVLMSVARLVNKHKIEYTVVGRGPEREKLKTLAKKLNIENHVNFIEYVPHEQIADEMYKHDIFIMPSYVETFGRVYFEAMAMGIPIICAKDSGIHGYYKEMQEGVTVVHHNIDDITDKLEKLIINKELRLNIGQQGQALVKNYTWDNITRKLNTIYWEAINKMNSEK
jgi:glycosyltransferase involved in cell wall biosynthesis